MPSQNFFAAAVSSKECGTCRQGSWKPACSASTTRCSDSRALTSILQSRVHPPAISDRRMCAAEASRRKQRQTRALLDTQHSCSASQRCPSCLHAHSKGTRQAKWLRRRRQRCSGYAAASGSATGSSCGQGRRHSTAVTPRRTRWVRRSCRWEGRRVDYKQLGRAGCSSRRRSRCQAGLDRVGRCGHRGCS